MTVTVHAEWTKMRTVPSTAWALLVLVVATVGVGSWAAWGIDPFYCPLPRPDCDVDTARTTLAGVIVGQVGVVLLAVLMVTPEFSTGMLRTTLAAVPNRLRVVTAKVGALTAAVLVAAALAVSGSMAAGRVVLPGHGFTPANGYPPLSLADEPTRRAYVGSVLYLGLVALLSFGVSLAVRHTGAAIATVIGLLYVVPIVSAVVNDPRWAEWMQKLSPMTAGLAVQATKRMDALPIGPWAGLGVLAAWATGALLVGTVLFAVRDA